jgi:hypothetical protein
MIELTAEQSRAVAHSSGAPPTVVDPETRETYVLLSKEEYDRLRDLDYDDSPWTAEEMDLLALEAGRSLGWDDEEEGPAGEGEA